MPPIFTDGGAVLVEDGLTFDLAKVLDACESLLDACTAAFGAGIVRTIHPSYDLRAAWPDPGRAKFRQVWTEAAKLYEAVDEPMIAVFPGLCLKIMPLGGAVCRYADGAIVTLAGAPIKELDPTPAIRVYGEERGLSAFALATPGTVEAVEKILAPELEFWKSETLYVSTDMRTLGRFAAIRFPHAAFGAGRGPIRVRCVRDA
jgi:hypothetical protein